MIILKVTKKHGFTLSLEDTIKPWFESIGKILLQNLVQRPLYERYIALVGNITISIQYKFWFNIPGLFIVLLGISIDIPGIPKIFEFGMP